MSDEKPFPWEARRAMRWGSEHMGSFSTKEQALAYAEEDIAAHGNVGRVTSITVGVVYYDVCEDSDV